MKYYLSLLLTILLVNNLSAQEVTEAAADQKEILTLWNTPGELRALDVFIDAAKERGLDLEVVTSPSYNDLRDSLAERISLDLLPSFSHWLCGEDLRALSKSADLMPLTDINDQRKIEDIIYPDVIPEISVDGHIVAIPVGIHLQSVILNNSELLKKVGYQNPPSSWEEIFEAADELVAINIKPFALSDEYWQLMDLFGGILTSVDQRQAVDDLFGVEFNKSGHLKETLEETLEIFYKLRDYSDEQDIGQKWSDVVGRIVESEAAMGFMGDFARSAIMAYGIEKADNIICTSYPDSETAIYGVDVFVGFERVENSRKDFDTLKEVVLDPKFNSQYVYYKGGLPVLVDADLSLLDQCSKNSLEIWNANPENRVAFSARDLDSVAKMHRVLAKLWLRHDLDPIKSAQVIMDYMTGVMSEEDMINL